MINRALDTNHDLFARQGGIALVSGVDQVVQHIKTRLQLFLGEWFLNEFEGVPWFQSIFVKPADLLAIEVIIKDTILQTNNVDELLSFDMNYDASNRSFEITFEASTDFGNSEETVDLVLGV